MSDLDWYDGSVWKIMFLKVELIDFINELDVGYQRKRRVESDHLFLS